MQPSVTVTKMRLKKRILIKKTKNSRGGSRAGSGQPRKTPTSTVSFRVDRKALKSAQKKFPSLLKTGKRNPESLNAQVNNFILSLVSSDKSFSDPLADSKII